MQYSSVINLMYSNFDQTQIDCMVEFVGMGVLPFTASKNDNTAHGREIFDRAAAGEFGLVADYVPNPEVTLNVLSLEDQQRLKRNQILAELDRAVSNPLRWAELDTTQQQDYARYRRELLDVPQQEGFPKDTVWPTPPENFVLPLEVTVDIANIVF